MGKTKKILLGLVCYLFLGCISLFFGYKIAAQSDTSADATSTIPDCAANNISIADCPSYLENKLNNIRGQEQTLSSQIAVMDNQIQLTQARIEATKEQINNLTLDIDTTTKKISSLQSSLNELTKILVNRVVATYEVGSIEPVQILLTSGSASNFLERANYLRIAQDHDKKLLYDTFQAKNDYQNQKQILVDKKQQIESLQQQLQTYTQQLSDEKANKQTLLAQTQGSEANYQSLLSQAQSQLAALSNFARSHIGAGGQIIPHQDLSDSWGTYFNQRDSNWGNNFIGGSSQQIWEVGCLLTSYAMVSSHYGNTITPAQVAADTGNFWSNTAYFLLPGPSANGHPVQDIGSPSLDSLRSDVQSGNAVIAGISYDGGPIADHWIVLRGVAGDGSFIINDPFYPGAMGVSINDHYAGLKIVEARVYH